ncbi:MAG TPA: PAS domain-containing protein [Pseudomonadales bacterium]|nr:PAS domain-containing protein [Pseudomonadales bacterium]
MSGPVTLKKIDHTQLRAEAETRLKQGTAPPHGCALGPDALALLHQLAISPDTAADAIKLLHELQTHQVELDLQRAQLEANEHEVATDLAHFRALYDFAPFGYLVVSLDGYIIESNLAGARLLGSGRYKLEGCAVDSLLLPASRPLLSALLQKLRDSDTTISCVVNANAGVTSLLHITASAFPGRESILMVVVDIAGATVNSSAA